MGPIGDEFLSRQRVLVISPHADDETYGCAGTIARIKDLGGQVYVSLISVDSLDHYAANSDGSAMRRVTSTTRMREFSEVMKLLKVDDWEVVYTDDAVHLALDTVPRKELVRLLERDARLSIEKVEPTLMLIPAFSYNQDHEALFRACISAHPAGRPQSAASGALRAGLRQHEPVLVARAGEVSRQLLCRHHRLPTGQIAGTAPARLPGARTGVPRQSGES